MIIGWTWIEGKEVKVQLRLSNSVWASMHGSKLLLDRLMEGVTEPERNLITIREDLGLFSETRTIIDIQVFHWRLDRRTRVEVVEQVKRNMGEFFRI